MRVVPAGTLVGVATGGGTVGDTGVENTMISMAVVGMIMIEGMIGEVTMMITVVVVEVSTRNTAGGVGVHRPAETTIVGKSELNLYLLHITSSLTN